MLFESSLDAQSQRPHISNSIYFRTSQEFSLRVGAPLERRTLAVARRGNSAHPGVGVGEGGLGHQADEQPRAAQVPQPRVPAARVDGGNFFSAEK